MMSFYLSWFVNIYISQSCKYLFIFVELSFIQDCKSWPHFKKLDNLIWSKRLIRGVEFHPRFYFRRKYVPYRQSKFFKTFQLMYIEFFYLFLDGWSFSKISLLKSYLCSILAKKLNVSGVTTIVSKMLQKIKYKDIIENFILKNTRRLMFTKWILCNTFFVPIYNSFDFLSQVWPTHLVQKNSWFLLIFTVISSTI
jgi:hypothetical protein